MRVAVSHFWTVRVSGRLTGPADWLIKAEPLWTVPALAFACMTLLWGVGWSWIGLVIASIPLFLRRWRLGYFSLGTPFEVPVALFLAASVIGLAVSTDRVLSLRTFESVLACILLYYSLANIQDRRHIKWGFAFAVVGVVVGGLVAFRAGFAPPPVAEALGVWVQGQLQYVPQVPGLSTVTNPIMTPAHGLAIALEMVLLPLIGLVLFGAKLRIRVVAVLASLPVVTLLLLLGSQGAWLAVLVGATMLLAWRTWWAVPSVGAMLGVVYLSCWRGWVDPHSVFSHFGPSYSLAARMDLWEWAADVIRLHPVTGCGLGCLGKFSVTSMFSPHNAYLQFYADMGLVGAMALLWGVVIGGRMALELFGTSRRDAWYGFGVGIVAAGVSVAVHGLFEGAPAGIIAETSDGYLYIVSPVAAILAGLLVSTRHVIGESASPSIRGLP